MWALPKNEIVVLMPIIWKVWVKNTIVVTSFVTGFDGLPYEASEPKKLQNHRPMPELARIFDLGPDCRSVLYITH